MQSSVPVKSVAPGPSEDMLSRRDEVELNEPYIKPQLVEPSVYKTNREVNHVTLVLRSTESPGTPWASSPPLKQSCLSLAPTKASASKLSRSSPPSRRTTPSFSHLGTISKASRQQSPSRSSLRVRLLYQSSLKSLPTILSPKQSTKSPPPTANSTFCSTTLASPLLPTQPLARIGPRSSTSMSLLPRSSLKRSSPSSRRPPSHVLSSCQPVSHLSRRV